MSGIGGNAAGGPLAAIAAMAAPAVASRALMSKPVQGYLGNQRLAPYINERPGMAANALIAPQLPLFEEAPE